MAGKSDIEAGRAFVRLYLKNELANKFKSVMQSIGKQVDHLKHKLMQVQMDLKMTGLDVMATGAAIAAPLTVAVIAGAKFEDKMLDIRGSTGATADDMAKIEAAALGMRAGPASVAESFLELLKAGMSLKDVLGGAGKVAIEFGKVGRMAAGQSAVVLADAMKVFEVSADTAANMISSAADASSTDIAGMAQAFSQASAVAAMANQSISDVSAALGILANNGIKGGDAGTSLKAMLLALTAPSEIASKKLTELGMSTNDFRDSAGKMLPLSGIIGMVNQKLAGLNQAARDEAFKKIFGTDAIRAAAILGKAGPAGIDAMKKSMSEALPIGEKYKIFMSGLTGLYEDAKAGAERLSIVVTKALAPSLQAAGKWIVSTLGAVTKFIEQNQHLVVVAAAVAAGIIAVGAAMTGAGIALSVVMAGLIGLSSAVAVFSKVGFRAISAVTLPFRLLGAAAAGAAGIVGGTLSGSFRVATSMLLGFGVAAKVPFAAIVSMSATAGAAIGSHIGRGIGIASAATAGFAARTIPMAMNALQGIGAVWKRYVWDVTRQDLGIAFRSLRSDAFSFYKMLRTIADPAYLKATWQDIRAAAGRAFRAMRSDGFSFYRMLRTTMDPAYLKATWASIQTGAGVAFRSARASVFGLYNALRTARGAAAGLSGTLGRVGAAAGRGLGRLGGAAGGLVGAAGMLGAMGIGGALAPVLMMAPLVVGVLGSIGTAVAAIASPVGLLAAAVVGGAVAWVKFSESGKSAWSGLLAVVLPIFETLKATFGGVKDAIMSGDWSAAGAITMAGLKVAFFQGLGGIEAAFGDTFAAVLRTVGKIGDGIVTAWDWVTGQLKTLWDNWGQGTLDTVLEVAGMIPDIWQNAVENMANSLLEMSAKGGLLGKVASKFLGVDMNQEQAKAEITEQKRRQVNVRTKTDTIKTVEQEISTGFDTTLNRQMSDEEIEAKKGYLTELRAQLADLKAGGSGSANVGDRVDVLAGAREAVKQYAENLRKEATASGTAGTGRVSLALDEFLKKVESGVSLADAKAEFDRLQAEQQTASYAADFAAAMEGGGGAAVAVPGAPKATPPATGGKGFTPAATIGEMASTLKELGLLRRDERIGNKELKERYQKFLGAFGADRAGGDAAASTAPPGEFKSKQFEGLTTYSAAAAQAIGFGGAGGGGPAEKTAKGVGEMVTILKDLGLMTREQVAGTKEVKSMYERFLAAFQYG